jgi:hypothetical protein
MELNKMASNIAHDEWAVVSEGSSEPEIKIVFDTIGDQFIGTYLGMREMDNDQGKYKQARFETDQGIFFTNANYSMKDGLKSVRIGTVVRLTYKDDMDTGQSQPMRVFSVEAKRNSRVRTTTPST